MRSVLPRFLPSVTSPEISPLPVNDVYSCIDACETSSLALLPHKQADRGVCGIGVQLLKCPNGDIIILHVLTGSVADDAGLEAGDQILAVDATNVKQNGLDCLQVARLIGGLEGTMVRLQVLSKSGRVFEAVLKREKAPLLTPERKLMAQEAAEVVLRCLHHSTSLPSLSRRQDCGDGSLDVVKQQFTGNAAEEEGQESCADGLGQGWSGEEGGGEVDEDASLALSMLWALEGQAKDAVRSLLLPNPCTFSRGRAGALSEWM